MQLTLDEKKGTFTLTGPIQSPAPSASGKSLVIASSHGNVVSNAQYDGKAVKFGLNVYIGK